MKNILKSKDLPEVIEFFNELRNYNIDIEPIIATIFRKNSIASPKFGNAIKETDPSEGISESQFRLNIESGEFPQNNISPDTCVDLFERIKQRNSLIIQHAPKSPK